MMFDQNSDIEVLGTSWNGANLDIFKVTIDRGDGRAGSLINYDGPAADHDYFIDAALPFQQYGIVAIGVTSRCKSKNKLIKDLQYRMTGGRNWRDRNREVSSFDENDPYNYDLVVLRF